MDSLLNIRQIGEQIGKVFPPDTQLVGRPLDEVFRLIRPDIHVEWDKVHILHSVSMNNNIFSSSRFSPMVVILSFSWKIVSHYV